MRGANINCLTLTGVLVAVATAGIGGGCQSREGVVLAELPKSEAETAPVSFRYAPAQAAYHYVSVTTANVNSPNSHTAELQFVVTVSKSGVNFNDVATLTASLVDGVPAPGITQSMLNSFKLTTLVAPNGAVISFKRAGNYPAVASDARDLGTTFELPAKPMKVGESWSEKRGDYTVTYKFESLQNAGDQQLATFSETAAAKGRKDEVPTKITVDTKTGVLVDKVAETEIPSGPNPSDPLVAVRSEIRLIPG